MEQLTDKTIIKGFAALTEGAELVPFEYEASLPQKHDVLVKVQACGVSRSDVAMLNNDWFCSQFPLVPGHEVVGVVAAVGDDVISVNVGDRVGLGWHADFCHSCDYCDQDEPHFCDSAAPTIVARHGGFASHVIAHEEALLHVPEQLSSELAAPLFCAGVTVFSPLIDFNISKDANVAVIGMGGLGHLALQFYKAWGCTVTAFTSREEKTSELLALGADAVVNSLDENALLEQLNRFDFILSTVNEGVDWPIFIACLRAKGRLHFVGLPMTPLELGVFPLVSKRRSISGSQASSPSMIERMLQFSVEHQIKPVVEIFPLEKVNDALHKLVSGQLRYRAVLTINDAPNKAVSETASKNL